MLGSEIQLLYVHLTLILQMYQYRHARVEIEKLIFSSILSTQA